MFQSPISSSFTPSVDDKFLKPTRLWSSQKRSMNAKDNKDHDERFLADDTSASRRAFSDDVVVIDGERNRKSSSEISSSLLVFDRPFSVCWAKSAPCSNETLEGIDSVSPSVWNLLHSQAESSMSTCSTSSDIMDMSSRKYSLRFLLQEKKKPFIGYCPSPQLPATLASRIQDTEKDEKLLSEKEDDHYQFSLNATTTTTPVLHNNTTKSSQVFQSAAVDDNDTDVVQPQKNSKVVHSYDDRPELLIAKRSKSPLYVSSSHDTLDQTLQKFKNETFIVAKKYSCSAQSYDDNSIHNEHRDSIDSAQKISSLYLPSSQNITVDDTSTISSSSLDPMATTNADLRVASRAELSTSKEGTVTLYGSSCEEPCFKDETSPKIFPRTSAALSAMNFVTHGPRNNPQHIVPFSSETFFNFLENLPEEEFICLARTVARYRRSSRLDSTPSTIVSVNLCGCETPHPGPVTMLNFQDQFWIHTMPPGSPSPGVLDTSLSVMLVELHADLNVAEFLERRLPAIVRQQVGNRLDKNFVVQIFGISFMRGHLVDKWLIGDLPECTENDMKRLNSHPLYRHMIADISQRTEIPVFRNLTLCPIKFSPNRPWPNTSATPGSGAGAIVGSSLLQQQQQQHSVTSTTRCSSLSTTAAAAAPLPLSNGTTANCMANLTLQQQPPSLTNSSCCSAFAPEFFNKE